MSEDATAESALIVEIPEADRLVGAFRAVHDPAAAEGVPPHVTVLYPFLAPPKLSAEVMDTLGRLFANLPSFEAVLAEIRQFPGVLYLAPLPDAPFRAMTELVVAAYPEAPPYGGRFRDVVPHLTVAHAADPAVLARIRAELAAAGARSLPVRTTVRDVTLIEKRAGRWRTITRFPLGIPATRR